MSIVLELTPFEEDALRREAAARRTDIVTLIREKVFATHPKSPPNPNGNQDPDDSSYSIERALAALDEIGKPEYFVSDAEWESFATGIDDARPGQRAIYKTGINPPATESETSS